MITLIRLSVLSLLLGWLVSDGNLNGFWLKENSHNSHSRSGNILGTRLADNYIVSCPPECDSINLVKNGDFELGDEYFTSDLVPLRNCLVGTYWIDTSSVRKCGRNSWEDVRTVPISNYMIIDADTIGHHTIWEQSVNVLQGNTYSYYFDIYENISGEGYPFLTLYVDDEVISTNIHGVSNNWISRGDTWYAEYGGIVNLKLVYTGNVANGDYANRGDFGIDNISFVGCSCNSIVEIKTDTICAGEIYTWQGKIFDTTGIYEESSDSTYILDLTVLPSGIRIDTLLTCDDAFRDSILILYAGLTDEGCDSIRYLKFEHDEQGGDVRDIIEICEGESHIINGIEYTADTVIVSFDNERTSCLGNGIGRYLTVISLTHSYDTVGTYCDGEQLCYINFNGDTIKLTNQDDIYRDILDQEGEEGEVVCDSIRLVSARLIPTAALLAFKDSVELTVGKTAGILPLANDTLYTTASSHSWEIIDYGELDESNFNRFNDSLEIKNIDIAGEYRVEYKVCIDACNNKCATSYINIKVTPDCGTITKEDLPNTIIFGQGENGMFKPSDELIDDCGIRTTIEEMMILNPNGDRLYHYKKLDSNSNTNPYWDGTTRGGQKVPEGTYFYIFKIASQEEPISGWLYVL